MLSSRRLTDIGLILVLLASINQTQRFTTGVVDPDRALGAIAFITAGLFAISIVQNRRNSLALGQSLTDIYVTSFGVQLAVDIIGVIATVCIGLIGVREFVTPIPFRIFAFLGGIAVGVTTFIIILLLFTREYMNTYADSTTPTEANA